ncbi:alpha/beta fold hydrolase [Falsirhodobacter halotolerans]|uniref:alpha/beta fold hydrolase n=1 Tax=Falsirhodobacter halotolerans TaxID=1146892 RepID=UPI001FD06B1F|nr:alpha/beta hydrolase [Falsirhodobacter halotolerans]MCJ8139067.1 alpha/beta hydrolase [Falsirhodobacter halotolerans]
MPHATARPTFVLLHPLGGSARSWDDLRPHLTPVGKCLALDLPGFGDLAARGASSVQATLTHLQDRVRAEVAGPWVVVGHSMGGKFATLMAATRPEGLAGVVLIAGSPPSPEPIDEARRRTMLGWVADGPMTADHAREFLSGNTAGPLPSACADRMVADLCRTSPAAWTGWLTEGVAEDCRAQVPVMDVPALILAGQSDGDLGPGAQRRLNRPFYAKGTVEVIDDAAHLIPQEQPAAVAAQIAALWRRAAGGRDGPSRVERAH